MKELTYVRAQSLEEALTLLNRRGVRSTVLAGGTDLVRRRNGRMSGFDQLVDVTHVPELNQIHQTADSGIFLGAAVTLADILANPMLGELVPLLVEACDAVGGPQVRNQATVGGNVANGAACADVATVLVGLEASALVAGLEGEHRILVADLIADLPGRLPPGSLIRAFEFKPPGPEAKTAFLRLGPREAMSIARVSLAVLGALGGDGRTSSVRLAWGSVFPHPRRVPEVEALILGRAPSEALFVEAANAMESVFLRESGDRWSAPHKRKVINAFTERGLRSVLGSGR